jgi:enoyl-CoA hydratase
MSESPVQITQDGPVTIITIHRPEAYNAIDKITADELRAAWLAFNADEDSRVAILTGGESQFCSGADLKKVRGLLKDVDSGYGPLGFTRLTVDKPTIAAIAGYCVAGGLELACWCDLRIADETAILGCFERKYGVPLADGGTQRLPRIIGLGRALDLILTGRPVGAYEAYQMGLVTEVVPKGEHLKRALVLAHQLAGFPQTCLRNDRRAVYEGLGKALGEGLKIEAAMGMDTISSGETLAGAEQFIQRNGRSGALE